MHQNADMGGRKSGLAANQQGLRASRLRYLWLCPKIEVSASARCHRQRGHKKLALALLAGYALLIHPEGF